LLTGSQRKVYCPGTNGFRLAKIPDNGSCPAKAPQLATGTKDKCTQFVVDGRAGVVQAPPTPTVWHNLTLVTGVFVEVVVSSQTSSHGKGTCCFLIVIASRQFTAGTVSVTCFPLGNRRYCADSFEQLGELVLEVGTSNPGKPTVTPFGTWLAGV